MRYTLSLRATWGFRPAQEYQGPAHNTFRFEVLGLPAGQSADIVQRGPNHPWQIFRSWQPGWSGEFDSAEAALGHLQAEIDAEAANRLRFTFGQLNRFDGVPDRSDYSDYHQILSDGLYNGYVVAKRHEDGKWRWGEVFEKSGREVLNGVSDPFDSAEAAFEHFVSSNQSR